MFLDTSRSPVERLLAVPWPALLGTTIIACVTLASVFAPYLSGIDPTKSSVFFLAPPGGENWLGTDDLGRDIYTRMLYGGRSSLLVGIGAALIATLIGVPVGLAAGYMGGKVDVAAVQFINMFIALPGLVLALMITAMIGPTLTNLMIVLGVVTWPRVARLVRGQAFEIREALFVECDGVLRVCGHTERLREPAAGVHGDDEHAATRPRRGQREGGRNGRLADAARARAHDRTAREDGLEESGHAGLRTCVSRAASASTRAPGSRPGK